MLGDLFRHSSDSDDDRDAFETYTMTNGTVLRYKLAYVRAVEGGGCSGGWAVARAFRVAVIHSAPAPMPQDPGTLFNNRIWNGALTIMDHIQRHPATVTGRAVVEFGAGSGLPSLVCGKLAAAVVVATDYPDPRAIATLQENVDANFGGDGGDGAVVVAVGHLWGADVAPVIASGGAAIADGGGFDVALMGDVLWKHDQHVPLLQSLAAVMKPGGQVRVGQEVWVAGGKSHAVGG